MTVIVIACMCCFRRDGLGGQDRDIVPASRRRGERAVRRHRSRPNVYNQTTEFVYMGGAISADWRGEESVEVARRLQRPWACFGRYKMRIYNRLGLRLLLKVRMPRAEVVEPLLYGCATRNPSKID